MGETFIALSGVSMVLLCLVVFVIATIMSMALWKFTRIVSSMPFKSDLNRFLIFIEILSIFGWAAGSFGIGIEYCVNYDSLYEYKYMRDITIMDLTTINANLINFTVMALILNRSSNAAGQRHKQLSMINPTLL